MCNNSKDFNAILITYQCPTIWKDSQRLIVVFALCIE